MVPFEIYVLCAARTKGMSFLDTFLPLRAAVAEEFPFPEFAATPTAVYRTPEEVMHRLASEPNEGY